MIGEVIILVFILSILYALFIYRLIKANEFERPGLSVISIFVVFVIVHFIFNNNLGYPVNSSLPKTFKLLHFHKSKDKIIVLITHEEQSNPRLHSLDYSIELEDLLQEATDSQRSGKLLLGILDNSGSNKNLGITFKEVERNLPAK